MTRSTMPNTFRARLLTLALCAWAVPLWVASGQAGVASSSQLAPAQVEGGSAAALTIQTVTYSYDAAGRLKEADYPNGRKVIFTYDLAGNMLTRQVTMGTIQPGDVNGDGTLNVGDVFYLINALFAGGPAPGGDGDVNNDGQVNVSDVFYLINYLFAGGPAPL